MNAAAVNRCNWNLPHGKTKGWQNAELHQWITHYDNMDKKGLTMQLHPWEHTHEQSKYGQIFIGMKGA